MNMTPKYSTNEIAQMWRQGKIASTDKYVTEDEYDKVLHALQEAVTLVREAYEEGASEDKNGHLHVHHKFMFSNTRKKLESITDGIDLGDTE